MDTVLREDQHSGVGRLGVLPFPRPLELIVLDIFVCSMTAGTLLEFYSGDHRCKTPCNGQESWRTKNCFSHNTKETLVDEGKTGAEKAKQETTQ